MKKENLIDCSKNAIYLFIARKTTFSSTDRLLGRNQIKQLRTYPMWQEIPLKQKKDKTKMLTH